MMSKLSQLRSSLFSLIKRNYYLEKWIGDDSLLSILQSQYGQKDLTKSYLNKYISHIGLDTINIFNHKEDNLLYQNQNVRRAYFYIFSSKFLPLIKPTRQEWSCWQHALKITLTMPGGEIYLNFTYFKPRKLKCWKKHTRTKRVSK